MKHVKKSSLVIIAVLIVILGLINGSSIIGNYYSSQSSSLNSQPVGSVVYIENGVSGVVTITDPFLNKTTDINVIYAPLDSGSGFIVNNNGYIITAFHVVGDPDLLNNKTLKIMNSNDLQRYIERAAVTDYISKYNPQLGFELGNNTVSGKPPLLQPQPNSNSTTNALNQRNLLIVKSSKQLIKIKLSNSNSANSLNANLVDVGNPNTNEDLALLKIDTNIKKLPSLTINSKKLEIGEMLQIFGYPVTNSSTYSDFNQSIIKPSSTTGFLTSGTSTNGTIYYGTNAITTPGYSGGPAVDSKNNVLGIMVYSVEFNQQVKTNSSLFLSSNYIIQICKKNNISINIV